MDKWREDVYTCCKVHVVEGMDTCPWVYHYTPRRQAVRGAMILSKEVRTVEVRGRNPRVLVVLVPFPANEILGFTQKRLWRRMYATSYST
jgi:hypothetical protein